MTQKLKAKLKDGWGWRPNPSETEHMLSILGKKGDKALRESSEAKTTTWRGIRVESYARKDRTCTRRAT
eukprot:6172162-Pyramimonas_sp.AAC.1